jgi:LAO/AO transport system kinase
LHSNYHSNYRRQLSVKEYVQGVFGGDRTILARAITLVESNSPTHLDLAQEVLKHLLPHAGKSIRIGITGAPGVGKSTFIETLGCYLCDKGHRVAVLAVDPSSSVTKGSILGDKTRMECLSQRQESFIRPSPSGGTQGGVTRKTRETVTVCEAAGFDVILIETVGVGQSEVAVRSMVDFLLLLMIAEAGDELQGVKKGVIELADTLLINKADGANKPRAEVVRQEYARVLQYLASATEGWTTHAYTCSSITKEGIPEIWAIIEEFRRKTIESGVFAARRRLQLREWLHAMVAEELQTRFYNHAMVLSVLPQIEHAVMEQSMPVSMAVKELLKAFGADSIKIWHKSGIFPSS